MPSSVLSDRYELGRVLGRGGMAEVREAQDLRLHRRVAVKILHASLADDPAFIERFRREATAVAALNHPGLVGIYDAGSDGDTRYLVMEYLEGTTLAELLREQGRLDVSRLVEVGVAAAGALEAVHRAGLVHRDVKPANIMITPDGGVKLMDLGIARSSDASALTATSSVIGTAAYLAPEQALGQPADARSDIYALGCVLYEAATGRQPFEGDSAVAVALQQVNAVPPVPSSLVSDLPADLDTILARAMAKEPALRYTTAADLSEDLQRLRRGVPVTAVLPATDAPTQAMAPADEIAVRSRTAAGVPEVRRNRTSRWVAAGLVAIAAVVGLIALAVAGGLFDGDGDDPAMGDGEVTEPQPDGTTVPEPAPQATADAPAPPGDATTTAPGTDVTDLAALDQAVAEVTAEADGALAAGEIDQSARDNLVDKAADAADKARSGDDDALDQVESLREELEDLRDDGDLTPPTFNRLRRAVDSLEAAITAVL
jgi:eukaryotic-like serine/threonine-protein kinase